MIFRRTKITASRDEDEYIATVCSAVDKKLDHDEYVGWQISREDDHIEIVLLHLDASFDSVIVYDHELSGNKDEDVSYIMNEIESQVYMADEEENITRDEFEKYKEKYNCSDEEALEMMLNNGYDADNLGDMYSNR